MTTTHTPGPWAVDGTAMPVVYTSQPGKWSGFRNGEIARIAGMGSADGEQQRANARLIAAAPELLAALERAAHFLEVQAEHYERNLRRAFPEDEHKWQNGAINYRAAANDALAAIAKARGE